MKLDTNIRYVCGHYCKRFQGQKLRVKVIARLNVFFSAEAYILTVCCRGSVVQINVRSNFRIFVSLCGGPVSARVLKMKTTSISRFSE